MARVYGGEQYRHEVDPHEVGPHEVDHLVEKKSVTHWKNSI